ncbi:MAG: hypothetical protein DI628_00840 [Blastochloris viridis]|uniref:Glucosamine inositolphosphorylceramide transferase 1 N-terminal domain-containing protein n=1 Tax=Blastochloris viridis TaxID=1079 RepID=A0A6N4RBU4_BLAVI|nr:MAG: hypothetical protein DI628_00840 [Blastochloris viridis]
MITRLLLMTPANAAWAEPFLAEVMACGIPVACLAGASGYLDGCKADVTAWYAGLAIVTAPGAGDCVVWLADKPRAVAGVPVVSVGRVAHALSGVREVARRADVTVVTLDLRDAQGVHVLDTRVLSTQRRWHRNREMMRGYAAVMLCDWLQRVVQEPKAYARVVGESEFASSRIGGGLDVLRYAVCGYARLVAEKGMMLVAKALRIPRGVWTLALVETQGDNVRFTPLAKPRGVVRADPFVATFEGKEWLFFEEYSVLDKAPKGELKCAPLLADGMHGDVIPFLARPYHLSYPQILHDKKRIFLLAESHAARRLELLLCLEEQGRPVVDATPVKVVMENASVADATFWQNPDTGERWLFASLSRTRCVDHAVELHLFKLGSTDGWTPEPHPMNPIVKDCRFARCAGAMYVDEQGRLIRPAQAHRGGVYGADVHLMEITDISANSFAERRVGGFSPAMAAGFDGVHHVCRLGPGRYLVDARKAWELS